MERGTDIKIKLKVFFRVLSELRLALYQRIFIHPLTSVFWSGFMSFLKDFGDTVGDVEGFLSGDFPKSEVGVGSSVGKFDFFLSGLSFWTEGGSLLGVKSGLERYPGGGANRPFQKSSIWLFSDKGAGAGACSSVMLLEGARGGIASPGGCCGLLA